MDYNKIHGDYAFELVLSNFFGARVVQMEDEYGNGSQDGIFIPFKENGLKETTGKYGRKYVVAKINLIENSKDFKMKYWYCGSHWSSLRMNKDTMEYIKSLGYQHSPRMGNMHPVSCYY